jgi:GWxTD domain-containing protein
MEPSEAAHREGDLAMAKDSLRTIRSFFLVVLLLGGLGLRPAAGGAKPKLDPESKKFFETARLIMSREEIKIFNHLSEAESRKEFIADFWAKRDPNPDTEANEFKAEFEKRVEYANKRYKGEGRPGWNTDRGRIHIFMGPPDKFEEFMTHTDTTVRGPILWWIYYDYQLGIEFVDEKGTGEYKIRDYNGNFFEAMDILKLGTFVANKDVFLKKIVAFDLAYDRAAGEITISIPAKVINFKENDEGKFQTDLRFRFYIYEGADLGKRVQAEERSFATSNQELEGLKSVVFRFAIRLKPGQDYIDVLIQGKEGTTSKVRKLFEVKG